jgi:hypothetical protein
MGTHSARYEPFAWWLAREPIGADLRAFYTAPHELPSQIRALVERIGDPTDPLRPDSTSVAPSLLSKLDAIEGNQLLRACRTRLRALCCLEQSGSST